jgi:hypothetical protein
LFHGSEADSGYEASKKKSTAVNCRAIETRHGAQNNNRLGNLQRQTAARAAPALNVTGVLLRIIVYFGDNKAQKHAWKVSIPQMFTIHSKDCGSTPDKSGVEKQLLFSGFGV